MTQLIVKRAHYTYRHTQVFFLAESFGEQTPQSNRHNNNNVHTPIIRFQSQQ